MANGRMTDAVKEMVDIEGKRVIDIGCGDGTYTIELMEMRPQHIIGIDAAGAAIDLARKKVLGKENIKFEEASIYDLNSKEEVYDVAVARGVLHHLDDVKTAIAVISKIAKEIIVVEPNGYNPVLKIIEKTSLYHIEHEEKSYCPGKLDQWFRQYGGILAKSIYIGLVPMFCSDSVARLCKIFEPFVEKTPLIRKLLCGQYVQKILMR